MSFVMCCSYLLMPEQFVNGTDIIDRREDIPTSREAAEHAKLIEVADRTGPSHISEGISYRSFAWNNSMEGNRTQRTYFPILGPFVPLNGVRSGTA